MIRLAAFAATFLAAIAVGETFPLPCRFILNDPEADNRAEDCAVRRENRIEVSAAVLGRMSFSDDGFAEAFIDHGWYCIRRDGATLPVITYDNGVDEFSEGRVRSLIGGRIAYFDTDFRQVVPPRYDWGWPFEDGKALVCIGCVESAPDSCGHRSVHGGRWGYIDRTGREIVSVTHSREELSKTDAEQ